MQAEIHQPQTIDISVRQIHTQEQAQAEIHRLRTINKARYLQRKERMLNDAEYREQQLQSRKQQGTENARQSRIIRFISM